MDLEEVFYIMAIIYMGIMFIIMIALLVATLVIKHKVHVIQRSIEERLSTIVQAVQVGEAIVDTAKKKLKRK